jgi:glucose/arabinose dehydrogenase/PKD repeat protein
MLILSVFALVIQGLLAQPTAAHEPDDNYEVLFFHYTTGFRHESIDEALVAVEDLGTEHGFSVTETQDPTVFTDATLSDYAAIVFFTDGENTLTTPQRNAFERYIHGGGGFVGLHSTSNTDKADWPWWEDLFAGAFFDNHPPIQSATVLVEDNDHPATAHLGDTWQWNDDEFYNFTANPRDNGAHVLLTVDESTYTGGEMGADHPLAWCNEFDGGRAIYTAMGHNPQHYSDPDMIQFIGGAIEWAAGALPGDCGQPRDGVPTAAAFEKVALDDNTANPMKLDIAPDGRVFYTELGGALKIYHPDTQAISTAAEIDVFRNQENGLLGLALDPDFDQNNHIFLFYSDPASMPVDGTTGGVQHVSRFTLDSQTETLDLGSEELLLEIPHQRQECCHSAGHMEFDSQGNLVISTGDDTNPFASGGFGPFDFRAGRQPWDAARSSGNAADLRGKILRINPLDDPSGSPGVGNTYTVPDDNLFTSGEHDDLFPGGTYDPVLGRPEIYVMGLRNPFVLDVDQESDHVTYGLVGPDANPAGGDDPNRGPRGYDYWNVVTEAGNFGWPFCVIASEPYRQYDFDTGESGDYYDCAGGPVNNSPNNTGIDQLPPVEEQPSVWYPYCNGSGGYTAPVAFPEVPCGPAPAGAAGYGTGRAAFAGDTYHFAPELDAEGKFPAYYDDKTFVMEWERDFIATVETDEAGQYLPSSFEEQFFGFRFDDTTRFRKPHDMEFGPDGNMYLIEWGDEFNFGGGGVNPDSGLYRISYIKGGRTPVAVSAATPDNGQPALEVSFSSEGSFDPDGDAITYEWTFGDGATSTDADPVHTYTAAGVYSAQLVVTDATDRSSSSNVTITVGNTRPQVTLEIPHHGQVFEWGDDVQYEVSVDDAEDGSTADGTIDCADVFVQSGVYHDTGGSAHVHPGASQSGCSGTISTPAGSGHEEGANVTLILTASYTDAGDHPDAGPLTGGVSHVMRLLHTEAEWLTDQNDISVAASGDAQGGGEAITGQNGAWAEYDPVNLSGVEELTLRVSSLDDTTVEVRRDAPDGALLGTAQVEATTGVERVPGQPGFGSAAAFNGGSPNQYAELPTGVVSGLDADYTIAAWVNRATTGEDWSRVFDFGSGAEVNMFLTPNAGGADGLRFAITQGGNSTEQQISATQELPTGWHHVAVTLDGSTGTLWLDGEPIGTNDAMTLHPADLGETTQNWLIRSQYGSDPYLNASLDEFHIFDHALSQAEVQSLMASPGGGNVAAYDFDEDGGSTLVDSSGQGNDASIVLSGTAANWATVPVDLGDAGDSTDTFPLYLVFPGASARVNWIQFGEVADEPPVCEVPTPVTETDDFDGTELDTDRWTVIEPDENLTVSDSAMRIQTQLGEDFFGEQGTLSNVVVQNLPDGAFTATAAVNWNPAQDFQNAGLVVWQDEDNYVKLAQVHAGGRAFELIKETGSTASFLGNSGVDASFPDDFLARFSYDGDTLTAEYSADGSSWTSVGTTDLSGLDDVSIGMFATNSTAATATDPPVASFDRFTLEYDELEAAPTTVSDDLSGTELDDCRWNRTVRLDESLLSVADGSLNVTTTNQDIFGGATGMPNIVLQDAPEGDWTIETVMDAPLARNWQNSGFMVYGDDDNYLKFNITATNQPGDPAALVAEMAAEVDGQADLVGDEVPAGGTEWWLRLTKSGTTYTGEWSPDGNSWTPMSDTRSLDLADPAVGLFATGSTSQQAGEEVTVAFECFELAGEGVAACPEPELQVPTVTATVSPDDPDGAEGWYVSPVTLTLEAADDPAAVVEYRLGEGDWMPYDDDVVLDADGVHDVSYRATNAAGSSDPEVVSVSVDLAAPSTDAVVDGELDLDIYLGAATLTLEATDGTSGVLETHFRLAGGPSHIVYDSPVDLPPAATYEVEYRSADVAGNVGQWQGVTVVVADTLVVVGGIDSGVANRAVSSGTTINDLILDDEDWTNHGFFVLHVLQVAFDLRIDGVITSREFAQLLVAAARSDVG